MNLTYFISLVSKDLITFILNVLTIAITSAVLSTLVVESVNNIKKDVFNKQKLNQVPSWIINLISNLGLVILFVFTIGTIEGMNNLILYIALVFIFSYILSVLWYMFIIKNIMLMKEFWTNKNKIKKIQSDLELVELEEKLNQKIIEKIK